MKCLNEQKEQESKEMEIRPVFYKGQYLYASIDGNTIGGKMSGANNKGVVFITTGENNIIGTHMSMVFDNQHEAEIRSHGIGKMVYFYPINENGKIYASKIKEYQDKYIHGANQVEKRLIVVIENDLGIWAEETFRTKKEALEEPKIISIKESGEVLQEFITTIPEEYGTEVKFEAYTITKESESKIIRHLN